MTKVGIIDYGCGNIRSVAEAFEFLGHETRILDKAAGTPDVSHMVLPGVGAFAKASNALSRTGLGDMIRLHIGAERPFLGICVGMQVLMDEGNEFGVHKGLGLVKGRTGHLADVGGKNAMCPHIGWAPVTIRADSAFRALDGECFYFNHSYVCVPEDGQAVTASPQDGGDWAVILEQNNITGIQCHPEKSHVAGLKLLNAFAGL